MADTSKLERLNDIEEAMWALMLEAGVALFLLGFIVWSTMFSGNTRSLPPEQESRANKDEVKD